ncbi:ABC transporter, periplasmic substrate-binding protein [Maridesulfovibrio hydrothermalis AM13 = DSM 14728]|uniref:ABC transporter, periplasmic substrate-binding protein n=2 Tax=Maridesulfovibrio TaxID=2794998 RepID=L0R7N1_9BACT|nr:ABC transporter, periplasmic substrate-binding protein [Maridesulfovibrio hydrothermalis AM13 = DSM 14728]
MEGCRVGDRDIFRCGVEKIILFLIFLMLSPLHASASESDFDSDLDRIKEMGVLRHIGVPYANFVTGQGDGLDVELMQHFARYLGVRYEFVESNWNRIFAELTGRIVKPAGNDVLVVGRAHIRGDVIANGLTILKWRKQVVNFSEPTFPTQVWCIARTGFPKNPIKSSGNIDQDIRATKALIKGHTVMGKENTCLAPDLYGIDAGRVNIFSFPGELKDMASAVIKGAAEITLLDVPDTLVALEKWPGKIKVLGPVSMKQLMAAGFRKDSPELLKAFNKFFAELNKSGEYLRMVQKYYPAVFFYYEDFFTRD